MYVFNSQLEENEDAFRKILFAQHRLLSTRKNSMLDSCENNQKNISDLVFKVLC